MAEQKVSIRYAQSLLDSAMEKNNLQPVFSDVELILSSLKQSSELRLVLENPVIKSETKISILFEIYKGKITEETADFLKFIVDKNREDLLPSIMEKFIQLYNEHFGLADAEVRTAFNFSDDQKSTLKAKLENIIKKKIKLNFRIDPQVIGGFIARVDDTVFDASVKHQLELLKKQFIEGGASLN
ncbi:MAG: ATP synthase F1 subunit delta [Ignavibacteriaceae bacterium]|nr:ATP synthase F1 subunit delta [Ignavibacteriaceae bacterium]